jgi:hypothetical protein
VCFNFGSVHNLERRCWVAENCFVVYVSMASWWLLSCMLLKINP